MIIESKKIIDENYGLAYQDFSIQKLYFTYFENELSFCTGFVNRYNKYKMKFEQLSSTFLDENYLNALKECFILLKKEIKEDVKNNIISLDKYKLDISKYVPNFNLIEKINIEILQIIENIENYFNEMNFINKIQIVLINTYQSIINKYNKNKMKKFDDYYNDIYKRTTSPPIRKCDKNKDAVKVVRYCEFDFFGICVDHKTSKTYFDYILKDNIKKIITKFKFSYNKLPKKTKEIKDNFIQKYKGFLQNINSEFDDLYITLNQYIENKIKNSKVSKLLENYNNIFNDLITSNSNSTILKRLNYQNIIIEQNFNNTLDIFHNNICLLKEKYLKKYFFPNYNQFIEYPREIIFKINQFQQIISANLDNIRKLMKSIYQNKINILIKSSNYYIGNFVNQHFNYILINLNIANTNQNYISSKYQEINKVYENCILKIKSSYKNFSFDNENIYEEKNIFSDFRKYNDLINNSILYAKDYISSFDYLIKDLINNLFPSETLDEKSDIYETEKISDIFINQSDNINLIDNTTNELDYLFNETNNLTEDEFDKDIDISKYNFNVVKLRTGIYYTKKLLENFDSLFDDLNLDNALNVNKINFYDNFVNDKNILNFYNETNYKLIQIKNKNNILINESIQSLMEYLQIIFLNEKDYSSFISKFEETLSLKNSDYKNYISSQKNGFINKVFILLKNFNTTLFKQISLKDNYTKYNINETYFKEINDTYFSLIENIFNEKKINSNKYNYKYNNSIREAYKNVLIKKILFYKDIINNIIEENNFNFTLLDIVYDIGEYYSMYIQTDANNYEFEKKYEIVKMIENFINNYRNEINKDILILKKEIEVEFTKIYNHFYYSYYNNSIHNITYIYVKNLEKNFTNCLNYSNYYLNESDYISEKDEFNYIRKNINLTFAKCSYYKYNESSKNNTIFLDNKTNFQNSIENIDEIYNNFSNIDINNYTLKEKIDFILDENNKCFSIFKLLENYSFYIETLEFLNCYNNDFFSEKTNFYDKFNDEYKNDLDNIINKIVYEIKDINLDENLIINYFAENYNLQIYKNIDKKEILKYFDDINNNILFVKVNNDDELKNFLNDILTNSFYSSYSKMIDNFIVDELIDNISVLINNNIETQIDYITNKIINEYDYYQLLLNNTKVLGINSKNAFTNLYKNLLKKLNETIFYLVDDKIYLYLDLFNRKNKNIFKDYFIDFYENNLNKYRINFNFLSEIFQDIFLDKNFNKTLDSISKKLIENNMILKAKNIIKDFIDNKINILNIEIKRILNNIQKLLNSIKTKELPEDMIIINELILNFTQVVNNQNNRYLLKMGQEPFNLLQKFTIEDLEPPLILIKKEYNTIEENFLNEIIKIIKSFPDYNLIVKENLNLESIPGKIKSLYYSIDNEILEYGKFLDEETDSYFYKLIHYVFINGLYTYNHLCNESSCLNDLTDIMEQNKINTNKGINSQAIDGSSNSNYYYDYLFTRYINQTKINELRKEKFKNFEGYDSKMGAIEEDEIEKYILQIQDTLYSFYRSYLGKEYRNIQTKSTFYFKKIANLYLAKLKKNIELSSSRFSAILTRDVYKKLEENLLQQYYKIESYIYNCNITKIESIRDKFLFVLNETSSLIEFNYIYFNGRVKNYYEVFSNLTQKNIKYISEEELKEYKNRKLEENKEGPKAAWNDFKSYFKNFKSDFERLSIYEEYSKFYKDKLKEAWNEGKKIFEKDEEGNIWSNSFKEKEISLGISFEFNNKEFSFSISPCINLFKLNFAGFYFPILPLPGLDLAVKIDPILTIDMCVNVGFTIEYKTEKSSISIGASISAYVGISLSLGIYIPSGLCPLHFEFSIGFEGILGKGDAGLDLIFYLNEKEKEKYSLDFHYSIEAITVNFFVKVGIYFSFKLGIFSFSFSFSYTIYEVELCKLYILNYNKIIDYLVKNSKKIACREILSQTTLKTINDKGKNTYREKDCL